MAENKIFAGPRIKQMRSAMELSQAAMAQELGISASYLNLIERNQRPITVQLILKLSSTYNISPDDLQQDPMGSINDLKDVFADPLLESELPNYEELLEVASIAPNVANGILKLHAGYRGALAKLSEMSETLNDGAGASQAIELQHPHDQVIRAMETRPNYFDGLDRAAEEFSKSIPSETGLWSGLQRWLMENHNIRTQLLPEDVMPEWNRRYDKHSLRLFIAERLSQEDRLIAIATQIAQFALKDEIEEAIKRLGLRAPEAVTLARPRLATYAAHAIAMPYRRFYQAAGRSKYDLTALAARFRVSLDHVAFRLTTLARAGEEGQPFSYLQVGSSSRLRVALSQTKFPHRDFGGHCAKLGLHNTANDGSLSAELVERRNEARYFTLSWRVDRREGSYNKKHKDHNSMLILPYDQLHRTVYQDHENLSAQAFGYNCRLCEIAHCAFRTDPPINLPISDDLDTESISTFRFRT